MASKRSPLDVAKSRAVKLCGVFRYGDDVAREICKASSEEEISGILCRARKAS